MLPVPICAHLSRAAALLLLCGTLAAGLHGDDEAGTQPQVERPTGAEIIVGMATNMFPYSYEEDGRLQGFAVDVFKEVATRAGLRIKGLPINNTEAGSLLASGRIDVIQFWTTTPERQKETLFSATLLTLRTVVVVRQDEQRIHKIDDLKGRTIATGSPGTVASAFVREHVPDADEVFTPNPEEILTLVSTGQADAGVLSRLTAMARMERLGITNLRVLDDEIKGHEVRYSLAVRRNDQHLLDQLNEGIAETLRYGAYEKIYDKWFGRHEPKRYTPKQLQLYVAAALAIGLIIVTIALLRQRKLSRRIASQATELLAERSLHTALFDNHPLATTVLEAASNGASPRLVSLNREAARLCGLDLATAAGRTLAELSVSAEIARYFSEIVERWPVTTAPLTHEQQLRDSRTELETTLVPLADGSAGRRRLCVLSTDVTKRRLADREVTHARRVRALGELVGGIAHEFNNLLTPVLMRAAMLRADLHDNPGAIEDLKSIEDAARRSADLTRRLLAFGRRSEEGPGSASIAAVVESCATMLRPTLDRRIEWRVDVEAGLPLVGMDSTDIHQVIFNLVINARDSLVERLAREDNDAGWSPRIDLAVRALPAAAHLSRSLPAGTQLAGWQVITVEDNGMGIAPEILERIFEPFFTTKEVGQGTGLGLATIWHLVTAAGGVVDVASIPHVDARFTISLPIVASAAASPGKPTGESPATTSTTSGRAIRVLMVEDEGIVARAALSSLRRLGHTVEHVADGAAAWDVMRAEAGRFDLLLVDINMPRMSGVDLVRHVRSTAWRGRIVVMSGRVAEPDLRELERLRVDRVLTKPFTIEELSAALAFDPA